MKSMQERIDEFDWASTSIGPRDSWPQSLRTSVSICVASRFPILLWWGPELLKLYNDAYAPMLGSKHPRALGARGRDVWPEIWPIIGPMLDQVMHEGTATWSDDQRLVLHRNGFPEECYFTFSYSPILDESGGVGGIFTAVFETTSRVIGERRLETLRQLAARNGEARSVEQARQRALAILRANPHDVTYADVLMRADAPRLRTPAPEHAITLPIEIAGDEEPAGTLLIAPNPQRPFDDDYRAFFSLVAGHIASAIADASAWAAAERTTSSTTGDVPHILLADASPDMREYLARLLRPAHEVECVADGTAALEAAQRRVPDLVLGDAALPGLDGFALLRALRSGKRTRDVPVVLLSAPAGEESRAQALEAGADDYLVKPFAARELLARVAAHLRLGRLRRDMQKALRDSEAKFSTAFDRSPLSLVITSLTDGKLVEVNEGFVRMSGYPREEAIGRSPDELGLWIEPSVRAERFALLREGRPVPDIEARFRIRNGEELIGFLGSAVVEINGNPCVLTSVIDITERKHAEDSLRESEHRFREFANTAPAMLWTSDPSGQCTFISDGWREFTGPSADDALGFGWTAALHPDDSESVRATFVESNERQEAFALDYRVRKADGQYGWASVSARPRFGPAGDFLGYVGSVIDITERKQAEQAKDEFLATLSHELRTPLTSGFGWARLLSRTREADVVDTGLRAIEESFINQMKLVDDLLDISRIAAGKLHMDRETVDVGSVIAGAIAMVRPSADVRGVTLRLQAHEPMQVIGDAARLKQVFWNLLSNAIKFTPGRGTVDVDVRRTSSHVEVTVRDTGEGIDPRFLPHVFARFRQADASTTRKYGGLGIGLSIVASLVAAHDGTVRAESDGLGKGAAFTVALPAASASPTTESTPAKTAIRNDGTHRGDAPAAPPR